MIIMNSPGANSEIEVFGEVHFSLSNKIEIEITRQSLDIIMTSFKIPDGEIVQGQSGVFWIEATFKFDTKGTLVEDELYLLRAFSTIVLGSDYMVATD